MSKPKGPLIVVSGPSGVGKTTVVDELLKLRTMPLRRAVTATTRDKRPGELEGVSYHYWNHDEFRTAIEEQRMLEHALVFDTDYYGTPRSEVDDYRADGTGVILVIDVQGAANVRQNCGADCFTVFIRPPSFEELEARLRGRGDVSEERVARRLATARTELERAGEFDRVIVNRNLSEAVQELNDAIRSRFSHS